MFDLQRFKREKESNVEFLVSTYRQNWVLTIFLLLVCLWFGHQLFVLGFNYFLIIVDFKSQPKNWSNAHLLHVFLFCTPAPFAIYFLCFIAKVFVRLPCCFFPGPACCRLTGTGVIHCDKLHRITTERGYLKVSRAEPHLICCGFWSYCHHRSEAEKLFVQGDVLNLKLSRFLPQHAHLVL